MNSNITIPESSTNNLALAGQAANAAAGRHVFDDYRARKSANTLRAQDDDLQLLNLYLKSVAVSADSDFATDPRAWAGVTWGLIAAFRQAMLNEGYAIGTVNRALSTIRVYAKLAMQAGVVTPEEYILIRSVGGYSQNEGRKIDEKRNDAGLPTRIERNGKPVKKADFIALDDDQLEALKNRYEDTPQDRMLRLMICLFLDHGLRCSEMALLEVGKVDRKRWTLEFYRPKTNQWEKHRLERDSRQAMKTYFDSGDAPAIGRLLRKTRKDGTLGESGLSPRAITAWVNKLGRLLAGINNLSAHDGRHTWATRASEHGTDTLTLMQAGGWTSPAMPARYVKKAEITNEGVKLE